MNTFFCILLAWENAFITVVYHLCGGGGGSAPKFNVTTTKLGEMNKLTFTVFAIRTKVWLKDFDILANLGRKDFENNY